MALSLSIILALAVSSLYFATQYLKNKVSYFPGPRPWLNIQNSAFLKNVNSPDGIRALELRKDWGDVVMFWQGFRPVMILNSPKAVSEILTERSSIYSSRVAPGRMRKKLWPCKLLAEPAGDTFRYLRKMLHHALSAQRSSRFRPYQDYESVVMMQDLLQHPESFISSCQRFTMSVTFSVLFGVRLESLDHPIMKEFYQLWSVIMKYFPPGSLMSDFIPILNYVPFRLQPTVQKLQGLESRNVQLAGAFFSTLQDKVRKGTAPDCFGKFLVEQQEKDSSNLTDKRAAQILGSLIGASSDTTGSFICSAFKVLAMYPDCQGKAQAEIDRVVGAHRLPQWDDEADLPYTRALIKEMHRFVSLAHLGMPHCATRDDWYEGKFIPKGTIVFPNIISVHRDPEFFEQPHVFDPTRFMTDDKVNIGAFNAATQGDWTKRDHFHYGYGRRMCPGIHVAEASIFIVLSRLLWGFDIMPMDKEPPLDLFDRTWASIWKPKTFKVKITVRDGSEKAHIVDNALAMKKTDVIDFDAVMGAVPAPTKEQSIFSKPII